MILAAALVEFLIALAIIMLFLVGAFGWWTERKRRIRMQNALKSVEHIQNLSKEVYEEKDPNKCNTVNQLIQSWNMTYSQEVGYTMPSLDCSGL